MRRVAVAVSGGRDSVALLHATRAVAAPLGVEVHALHVHHGLMREADAWRDRLAALCERWDVPLSVQRLEGKPAKGDSVEAWARRERYAALAQMAREADASLVLLAHHRRDQAETFLLQALRGAGAAGLAAMPRSFERDAMQWARPWLDLPREAIERYVRRHRLPYVDDTSNDDPRFARGRLRREVWPALSKAFPDAEGTLVESARRAQEAAAALAELAELDLHPIADAQGLDIERWAALSSARRANALREWLRRQAGQGAPQSLVERLCTELTAAKGPARWPLLGALTLRRWRGRLSVEAPATEVVAAQPMRLDLSRPGLYRVPGWDGTLQVREATHGGVAAARLGDCELRPRLGAEQFQAGPGRPARSLKKQFQAAAIAPWQRHAPLLWCGGALVFVPGLGIDARALADEGEPQRAFDWLPG